MASIEAIVALANGAKFYRAGLHIQSFGGSHDVKDPKMTQHEIVSAAIFEKVRHYCRHRPQRNQNVKEAIKAAEKTRLGLLHFRFG